VNRWTFVIAAYAIGVLGTLLLTAWSYAAMRRAERAAEALRKAE
jgi:hypothetical protein